MGYIQLSKADWDRVTSAIESSFTPVSLYPFVAQRFPAVVGEVPFSGLGHSAVVFHLVDVSNRYGLLDQLIAAVAEERANRPDVRGLALDFSQRPGWQSSAQANGLAVDSALELLTSPGEPFFDTTRLAAFLIAAERCVCQVRCGLGHGTGFLIAPDLVLTCYHVVNDLLRGDVSPSETQVRFDYRRSADGVEPSYEAGGWISIDPDWPIPNAPYSPADIDLRGEPAENELDFAVLRLKQRVGQEPPLGEDKLRGWFDLSSSVPLPPAASAMFIVQHPQNTREYPPQRPLQVSLASPGYQGANPSGTRMIYGPSTLNGSSGSPVFDRTLRPVALHHNRGEMNPNDTSLVQNNRGVPLGKIQAALPAEVRELLLPTPGSQ